MARINLLFLNKIAGESTHFPEFKIFTAEDDAGAASLMNQANEHMQEMNDHMAIAEKAADVAKKAEKAGIEYQKAAAAAAKGEEVSEAAIAKADTKVNEIADKKDVPPEKITPDVKDEDRKTVEKKDKDDNKATGESDSILFLFKPAYSRIRKDPVILRRCSEGLFSEVGSFFSSVWDSILTAWDHFCQWVGKYFGTYPRAKSRFEALEKTARKGEGVILNRDRIEMTGADASNLTTMKNMTDAEPMYLDDLGSILEQLENYRKNIEAYIEHQRQYYNELSNIASTIAGGQYSNKSSAEDSAKDIEKALNEITGNSTGDLSKTLVDKYTDNNSKGIVFSEHGKMTGYKRLVNISASTKNSDDRFKDDPSGAVDFSGFKIIDGDPENKKTTKKNIGIVPLTLTQAEDISREVIRILDELINYQQSRVYLKGNAGLRKVKDAADKLKSNINRDISNYDNDGNDKEKEEADKLTRELSKLAVAHARKFIRDGNVWQNYLSFYDRFMFTIEKLINRSIAAYS